MALRNRDLTFVVRMQNLARAAIRDLQRDLRETGQAGNTAARGTDASSTAMRRSVAIAREAARATAAHAAANARLGNSNSALARTYFVVYEALQRYKLRAGDTFDFVRDRMSMMTAGGAGMRALMVGALGAVSTATLAFGLVTRGVTTDYAAFDKQMASVNSALREGNEPIDKLAGKYGMLREKAKELSAATEYSATEVGGGMDNLVRAGFNAAQTAAAIKPALDLATTGSMSLADTTERLGAIMSQYQLDATEAGKVTDILAFVNAKTAAGIPDLAQAFKYAGTTSNALGISVNETAAALGVLADNGIKGFAAGSAIRELELDLLRLANGTAPKKAQAALASLKIDKEKIDPRKVGLLDAIKALEDAKIDKAQLDAMFGSRGVTPFTALAADFQKAAQIYKESGDQLGYNARQADDMRNNLSTSIDKMKKAWSNLMIAIGDAGVGNAIKSVVDSIGGAITKTKEFIDFLNSGSPQAEEFKNRVYEIAGGVGAVAIALALTAIPWGVFATGALSATAAVIGFTAALLLNPIGWFIGLAAAAGAAFVHFGNEVYLTNGQLVTGWTVLKAVWAGTIAYFGATLDALGKAFSDTFNGIKDVAAATGNLFSAIARRDGDAVAAAIRQGQAGAKRASSGMNMDLGKAGAAAYTKAYGEEISRGATQLRITNARRRISAAQAKLDAKGGKAGRVRGGDNDTQLDAPEDTRDNGFNPSSGGSKGDDAAKGANKFNNALKSLMQTLAPVIERGRQYVANLATLKRGLAEGALTQAQYDAALGNLEEQSGQSSDAIGKLTTALGNEAQTLGVSEGAREAANRVFALELEMRKDGIAYLKDGVLQMDAETRKRYENAKAMIAQSIAAKALQDAKDAVTRADEDNDISRRALALPEADRAAFETAERAKLELRRKGVTNLTDLAVRGAEAVRVANETGNLAAKKSYDQAKADADMQLKASGMVGYAKERFLTVEQKRLDLLRNSNLTQEQANALAEQYGVIMDRQHQADEARKGDFVGGAKEGLRTFFMDTADVATKVSGLVSNSLGQMGDLIADFVLTGKANFGEFARSVIADITRMITRLLLMKAIEAGMNAVLPGSGTALSVGAQVIAPTKHTGGMVGAATSAVRAVDPSVFRGAKRLHSGGMVGLRKGERPIIALDTERVLNPEETRAYNAGLSASSLRTATNSPQTNNSTGTVVFAPQINNDFSGLGGGGGAGGGGGMSDKDIAEMSKAFENDQAKFMEDWLQKEMRPGGRLANRR